MGNTGWYMVNDQMVNDLIFDIVDLPQKERKITIKVKIIVEKFAYIK